MSASCVRYLDLGMFVHWRLLFPALGFAFIAELGDGTESAVSALSGTQTAPWIVFGGNALALTAVTALGVTSGQQLYRLIPRRLLMRMPATASGIMAP